MSIRLEAGSGSDYEALDETAGEWSDSQPAEGWADDLKLGLEREIKDMDRQIREARRAATTALTLEQKLADQRQIKDLESQRSQRRRSLFDAQDRVDDSEFNDQNDSEPE